MSESAPVEGGPPVPPGGDPSDALLTYRYLRFGILGAVILLTASIVYEFVKTDPSCLQGSVSADHYTPVRSVFVGTLMAIGLCLIVIRGRGTIEDIMLNLAGMLAPVVALVPTSGQGSCASIRQSPKPTVTVNGEKQLADWLVASIQNNVTALLATGVVALACLLAYFRWRGASARSRNNTGWRVTVSLGITTAVVVVGAVLFVQWNVFERHAHYVAAITMFAFFGVVVLCSDLARPPSRHRRSYRVVWILMLVGAAVAIGLALTGFGHTVFVLEAVEIVLFAAFWVLQSLERWFDPVPAEVGAVA